MSIQREEIPESVFAALEVVRQSGETNMLDRAGVYYSMIARELEEEAEFILEHKADYGKIVMVHFSDWLTEKKNKEKKP